MLSKDLSRFIILTALFFILSFVMALPAAQAQLTQEWAARYDGYTNAYASARAMATDNAGHVFVTGFSYGPTSSDYVTLAYDTQGNLLWSATYDGPGHLFDTAAAIAVGPEGNVYVTGKSAASFADVDYATVAYDSQGNQLWVARYDEDHVDDYANAITTDPDGNIYVTGRSRGLDTSYDYATVAYDPAGNQLWVARYNGPSNAGDEAVSIAAGPGAVYVTGNSVSGTGEDYATVAYDAAGNELWVARYDGPGHSYDYATAVAADSEGHVYVTGRSVEVVIDPPLFDYATLAYDSSGSQLWVARYDGPAHGSDEASSLAIGPAGNVFVTGTSIVGTSNDFATVAYDPSGNQLWAATYDGPAQSYDYAKAVVVGPEGNVYVTGDSVSGLSNYDYATLAYDAGGDQLQVFRYDGPAGQNEDPFAMITDETGNVYVTGQSVGSGTGFDFVTIKYATDQPVERLVACIDAVAALGCTGPGGAEITLDGSCSSGNVQTYTWDGPFGSVTGELVMVAVPLGTQTITLTVGDGNGGTAIGTIDITAVDSAPPDVSYQLSGEELIPGLYLPGVFFEMAASDDCAGVADVRYVLDGQENIVTGSYASVEVSASGEHVVVFDAEDNAGNTSAAGSVSFSVFEADAAGIKRLTEYFIAQGAMDDKIARSLNRIVEKGAYDRLIKRARIQSGKKIDPAAAQILVRAATFIMDQ